MFSTGKKCKLNRTLYNTQLIQFVRIPAEFVVRFIRYQYRMKVDGWMDGWMDGMGWDGMDGWMDG